jgi:hypothetical protein
MKYKTLNVKLNVNVKFDLTLMVAEGATVHENLKQLERRPSRRDSNRRDSRTCDSLSPETSNPTTILRHLSFFQTIVVSVHILRHLGLAPSINRDPVLLANFSLRFLSPSHCWKLAGLRTRYQRTGED